MKTLLSRAFAEREDIARVHAACRLFDGAGDGLAWFFVDRYGPIVVAHIVAASLEAAEFESAAKEALEALAPRLRESFQCTSIYLRVHPKDARDHRQLGAALIAGEPRPEHLLGEGACRFIVRPEKSVHAGLYTDTRELREYLRANCRGKRVLNLFCFTGTLGVAAALGGASEIAQVDSSPAALAWAKANWRLNQGDLACAMRFICDDCRHFLDREAVRVARGGKRTALALVDPPSFGRGRKRTFSFKRDVGEILEKVLCILDPEGEAVLTANGREFSAEWLEGLVSEAARKASWQIGSVAQVLPPPREFRSRGRDSIAMRGVRVTGAISKGSK